MIQPTELATLNTQVTEHLFNFYLPFWCGPAVDRERGGWMASLTNDLKPDRSQPKGLIVHSRILWAFSAAHRTRPDPVYFEMAERAYHYLISSFWDAEHGGTFWRLNDEAQVIDDSKKIYGQAFCIYALSEFNQAFGNPAALARARELFELLERHAHDPKHGGYLEVCRRDWSPAGPEARLSDKDMNEKKSMNNHLHVLEAFTQLHRIWPDARVAARLRELIEIFLTRIIDPQTKHLHHFFDEEWHVRSETCTYGHDIEASWLLCEAAEELRDVALLNRIRPVALQMANVVLKEAVTTDGGIGYEGKDGGVIDAGRECWPQAEAMVGFLNAFEISLDGKYLAAAIRVWHYIQNHLVDRTHGEWFWRIEPDGQVNQTLPKVSEWKGPYHVTRACLEIMQRAGKISGSA
jgi:mannobiose 2-epimerase